MKHQTNLTPERTGISVPIVNGLYRDGNLKAAVCRVENTAKAIAIGDTIELVRLPAGTLLIGALSAFAGATAASVKLEIPGVSAAFAATAPISLAATAKASSKLTEETVLTAVVSGAAIPAGSTFEVVIVYACLT